MNQYYPIINLLRGVAALMVCLYHFISFEDHWGSLFGSSETIHEIAQYGAQGVFIFFVISGVVIPVSMLRSNYEPRSFLKYLWRRWIRIEIPYIASIALVLFVAFIFAIKNGEGFDFEFARFVHHLTYTVPFSDYDWYNVIYWTLAIEFQFYILLGLLYYFLQLKNKWVSMGVCILITFGVFISGDPRFVFYYGPIFAIGIVTFLYKTKKIKLLEWSVLLLIGGTITWWFHGTAITIFSMITALTIAFYDKPIGDFGLGKISYSLYLTHGVIGGNMIYLLGRNVDSPLAKTAIIILAVMVSMLFAWAFWKFIEDPARKLSKKVKM